MVYRIDWKEILSMENFIVGPIIGEPIDVKRAYEAINNEKEIFGKFHKTVLHVHTPESHDYKFLEVWSHEEFKRKTEQDIADIFFKLFNSESKSSYKHAPKNIGMFDNETQFWAFMALAKAIVDKEIEVVVAADHNTLKGIRKLEEAIKRLNQLVPLRVYPIVIGGIEISCADKVHVVGIFNHSGKDAITDKIETWLSENLISITEGTIKTSYDVIRDLKGFGAIAYIAHVNTADIFKNPGLYSGGYRKKLFTLEELTLVGINNIQEINFVKKRLKEKKFRGKDIDIVLDNDSHSLDTIDNNIIWIKGETRNFDMIAEAINDFDVSIELRKTEQSNFFIKGVLIEPKYPNNTNFLIHQKGSLDKPFVIRFSNALNCIIGGRGTGKSTLLRLLEFALSLRCNNRTELEYLCKHGNMWILFEKGNEKYMIGMLMPYLSDEKGKKYYYLAPQKDLHNERMRWKDFENEQEAKREAFQEIVKVYKIVDRDNMRVIKEIGTRIDKLKILKDLYDTSYSVNDLVNIADDEIKLTNFLKSRFLVNQSKFPLLSKRVTFKTHKSLSKFVKDLPNVLKERESVVKGSLKSFNEQKQSTLRIEYKQTDRPDVYFSFEKCINGRDFNNGYFYDYNIDSDGIYDYLYNILDTMNIVEFFNMILNNKQAMYKYPIVKFAKGYIRRNLREINEKNQSEVIDKIIEILLSAHNISGYIKSFFKDYLDNIEKFELKFDLSSNSISKNNAHEFKNVNQLSLGQKVVAMLSFILAFSAYNQDYKPLLIDQPEDNLDSQYIYESLVQRLRQVKDKRQVIIATHNATIVTNAMADQVCVMKSDGMHGWIDKRGYPGTEKIKKAIINYLEGGVESFKHKQRIYKKVIEKEKNIRN